MLMPASLAKFCEVRKQHIANRDSQNVAMPKSLNQVLGEVLSAEMKRRHLSANALGARAGLAPNTIGNYMRGAQAENTAGVKGKERSAKLAEVERLAQALGVSPIYLLSDRGGSELVHIDEGQALDPEVQQVATEYASLTPTERRRFRHLLAAARDEAPILGDDHGGERWIGREQRTEQELHPARDKRTTKRKGLR
jgi:transcriptional regulator with XRE-family HTH domain